MRKSLVFLLLLFVYSGSFAQTDTIPKTNGYFSIGFGALQPVGVFSSVTGTNPGRYATIGTSTFISAGIVINKLHFGFAIKEGWYSAGFNSGEYINAVQATDSLKSKTVTQEGGGNRYNGGYGMIGLVTDIKIHNLLLEFELLGGRLTANFPEISYSIASGSSTSVLYDISASQTQAFAFDMGISARLPFYRHFCLKVDFDYLYSYLPYAGAEQFNNSPSSTVTTYLYYNCPLSFISGTLGIAYRF